MLAVTHCKVMRVIKSIKLHSNKVLAGHCALSVSSVMMLWDAAFPVPPESMARWCDAENIACWCSGYIFPRWPWQRPQCCLYQNHLESVELGRAIMRAWNKQVSSPLVRKKDKLRMCVSLKSYFKCNGVCLFLATRCLQCKCRQQTCTHIHARMIARERAQWLSKCVQMAVTTSPSCSVWSWLCAFPSHKSAPGQPHMPFINDISTYRQDLKIIQVNCFQATKYTCSLI